MSGSIVGMVYKTSDRLDLINNLYYFMHFINRLPDRKCHNIFTQWTKKKCVWK